MNNVIKKIKGSIFIKLILILIISDILTNLLVGGLFKFFVLQHYSPFEKNTIRYANYIIQEIGTPPDTLKARKISQELSIDIRIENSGFQWTTNNSLQFIKDFDRATANPNKPVIAELDDGVWSISINQSSTRYLFAFNFDKVQDYEEYLSILLIVFLTSIFIGAFFLIRRILKPVHLLTDGVEQISKGNLDYQVPLKGIDELGTLTGSFNSMTKRIREMIRSKEQLLLDVSHELRSPLTRIKVALEFIPEDKTKQSIQEDLSEVESMITEILESERLNSSHGKLYVVEANISDVIEEVAENFKDKLPGVRLISIPENVVIKIDVDRIKTVLRNILENSIKYSMPQSQPIEISVGQEEKHIVIKIKDFGSGISKAELPYIFEPFYRIDRSRSKDNGGYGLGLSLCKKIMEAHGGTIEINSIPGEGTTVLLEFLKLYSTK